MAARMSPDVLATPAASKPGRVKPIAALRAIIRLMRDPQDTKQVFLLTEALRGRSGVAPFQRFCASFVGQRVLTERRYLLHALSDRAALAALPEESLGRAYLSFRAAENLSAEGLVEVAGVNPRTYSSPDESVRIFATRMRDMHDLYHVLAGYGRDELGEVCVLAFSYPQQKIRSFLVISAFGALRVRRLIKAAGIDPSGVLAAVREASRHGREAAWLPGEDLEAMMTEDLQSLRRRLSIKSPVIYNQLIARGRNESGVETGLLKNWRKPRAA
jgi:ubiquinone biosynthesis protein COQ4